MGIVNVTPDSFFDGGKYHVPDLATEHCETLIENGADIIDIGGESSRPGSQPVDAKEERNRVIPVIRKLCKTLQTPVSVDTTKAEVAQAALDAGATIINDISGFTFDENLAAIAAKYDASVVINHIQGTPADMQQSPEYPNVTNTIKSFFQKQIALLLNEGVSRDKIAVDPGIGFGKTLHHNFTLINQIDTFGELGNPILLGASRKSFIGKTKGLSASERLYPSLAVALVAALKGVSILRVHDVKETWEQIQMIDELFQNKS
ncbi:MAG: dihydropteroate synthase [Fibrobacteria bacterium]|nr:dihydropteroate synthase [Fibrobacteria bacterium]